MKIDPYQSKESYLSWRESISNKISGITEANSEIILRYLDDMERGANIATGSPKGGRGYLRLQSLKARMIFFAQSFEKRYNLAQIIDVSEDQIISFFADMINGFV